MGRRRTLATLLVVGCGAGSGVLLLDAPGDQAPATAREAPAARASTRPSLAPTTPPTAPPPPPASRPPDRRPPATVAATTTPPADPGAPTPPPRTPPRPAILTHRADIDVLASTARTTPVGVELPNLGDSGPVLPVGVDPSGEMFIPPDARTLVWYAHGPSPGEKGSAVIAGHLDFDGVLGVFRRLADSAAGDVVTVAYSDGSRRHFVVTVVELVPKPAVAVHGVFRRGGPAMLRLVTCGGAFDDETNHYLSNVVVTAVPA